MVKNCPILIFSDVCEAHNRLINGRDRMLPDFLQPIIPTLTEDCSQCSTGPYGPGFLGWAWKTMYYWYTVKFFYKTPEDKYEAETISVDYIIFQIFKIILLCVVLNLNKPGPKGPMPHGKGLDGNRVPELVSYLECPLYRQNPQIPYPLLVNMYVHYFILYKRIFVLYCTFTAYGEINALCFIFTLFSLSSAVPSKT